MGVVQYVRDLISYVPAKIAYERGFYEASRFTQANKDFINANSDFETTALPERNVIRARARWLSANNSIMARIDEAILNNVIGSGIKFQSTSTNIKHNENVEKLFQAWCRSPKKCSSSGLHTFYDIQRMILKSRMVDGEIFIYKRITKDGLRIQLIEADSLDTSKPKSGSSQGTGIELDNQGQPKLYHFIGQDFKSFSIDAKYIINYFKAERPTQYRGISEYKSCIIDIKNFSAYQQSSIIGARARANIAYAITGTSNPANFNTNLNEQTKSIGGVEVLHLKNGESINKLDPDSVATDYSQFSETTIRGIASGRFVSYELAYQDYSKVNFASSRASLLQDFKRFDFEQDHLVAYILDDIFENWLMVERLRGTIPKSYKPSVRWVMPRRDWVDPLKDATALEKKIEMNMMTETDACLANGYDYEEVLIKKKKEQELKAKHGIPDLTLIDTGDEDNNDSGKVDLDEHQTGGESNNKDKDD